MRIRKMVWVNDPQVPRISVDSIGMQRCLINIEPPDKRAETVQICRRLPFLYVQLGGVHDTPPTLSWRVKVEHPKAKGEKTEAILIAEFVKRDFKVLLPFGDNLRYDLVLDTPAGFKRVQCKTGRLRNGSIHFSVKSVRSNTKGCWSTNYHGDIDFFAVYCPENQQAYVVPIDRVGTSQRTLRVEPFKRFGSLQGKDHLLAEDFKLEKF